MTDIAPAAARRRATFDYDAPVPGEAERQRATDANAPWAADFRGLPTVVVAYAPEMFDDAAQPPTPAPATAPEPPPSPPQPAPDAYQGITFERIAEVPPLPTRGPTIKAGVYDLHAAVDGSGRAVYYSAFNRETLRTDYVVGPASLDTFREASARLENVAAVMHQHTWRSYEAASAKVTDGFIRKGFEGALPNLALANALAARDPAFWGRLALDVASRIAAGNLGPTTGAEGVNPRWLAGTYCASCAIATDAVLAGRPATAVPVAEGRSVLGVLEDHFDRAFEPVEGPAAIERALTEEGPGARAIIGGERPDGRGHVFNAVNQGGVVRFIDGQTGLAARVYAAGYTKLEMMITSR